MTYPCDLCGASPDLGQGHASTCPTVNVYDDYEAAARRAGHAPRYEHTLNLGAWVSVVAMVAVAVLLVVLIEATKGDGRCITRMASDGQPVSVCTPEAPKTRNAS